MDKAQISVGLFTAIFAFAGAIGGVFFSDKLRRRAWQKEIEYEEKREIFSQRIKLLERAASILNKIGRMKSLEDFINLEIARAESALIHPVSAENDASKEGSSSAISKENGDSELILRLQQEKIEFTAEIGAVAQLSSIYFGEKTRAAFRDLSSYDPWFRADSETVKKILRAMSDELLIYDFSPNKGINTDPKKHRS